MAFYLDKVYIEKFVDGELIYTFDESSASLYSQKNELYYKLLEELPICIKLERGFVFWEDYPKTIDKKIIKILKDKLKGKKVVYLKGNLVKEVIDRNMTKLSEVLIKIIGRNM